MGRYAFQPLTMEQRLLIREAITTLTISHRDKVFRLEKAFQVERARLEEMLALNHTPQRLP